MLILALLLRAFQPPKPASRGSRHCLSPGAENKDRCILLCSVGYLYVASLASVVGKVRGAWVK